MLRTGGLLSVAIALVGCSSSVGPEDVPPSVPAAATATPIAKLVTRDRSIVLFAGHGTVRANVFDASGRLIARDIDIDALHGVDLGNYDASSTSSAGRRETLESSGVDPGPRRGD